MAIPVMRYKRKKLLSDENSPELYYLKRIPKRTEMYDINEIAQETEVRGSLTSEDVVHVMGAFVRQLLKVLAKGHKVKVDKLGIFYSTFNCEGSELEKDCTVKKIRQVNLRFAASNSLRLVNNANATTRGVANNVLFYIEGVDKKPEEADTNPSGTGGSGGGIGGGGDEGGIDPDA